MKVLPPASPRVKIKDIFAIQHSKKRVIVRITTLYRLRSTVCEIRNEKITWTTRHWKLISQSRTIIAIAGCVIIPRKKN